MVQTEADRWEQTTKSRKEMISDDGRMGSLLFHVGKPLESARSRADRVILAGCQA